LVQLQKHSAKLARQGIQIVVVSYDAVSVLKKFAAAKSITYPMLSDPKGQAIRAYRVLNRDILKDFGFPAAHPGTFVLDRKQVVRAKLFLKDHRKRHKVETLIDAAAKLKTSK